MKATEILKTAHEIVSNDRAEKHGDMKETHELIADYWNLYLITRQDVGKITARDVAIMMVLLKIARSQKGKFNADDYIDIAGYAACAVQIETDNE